MVWDSGGSNSYRMGAEGKYDLVLAPSHDPDKLQRNLAAVKGVGSGVPPVGAVKPKGLTAADAAKSKVRASQICLVVRCVSHLIEPFNFCFLAGK